MGIFDNLVSGFFKSVNKDFHKRVSIIGFIQICESMYEAFSHKFPEKDPHELLVGIYNYILMNYGGLKEKDLNDPMRSWQLLRRTLKAACIPSPICARALAYIMISRDEELIAEFLTNDKFKFYREEYDKYLIPLFKADKDYIKSLYYKYNINKENQELLFKDNL